MKSLYIKSGKVEAIFNDLKDTLNGTLSSSNGELVLVLNSDLAKGKIEAVSFPQGMIYLQVDLTFIADVMLSIEYLKNAPLLFTYCSKGSLKHSLGTLGTKSILKKDHSAILKSTSTINNILYFEKDIPIQFAVIGIASSEKGSFANDLISRKLKNSFSNIEENIMHVQTQNFKIAEKIKSVGAIKQNVANLTTLQNQIVQSILEIEVEQKTDSFTKLSENIQDMTLKQMDEIKKVSNFINNLRVEDFIAKFVTQKLGLPINKFQKIFNW